MKEKSLIYEGLSNEARSIGEKNDCGVRALAVATGRSYADCHKALKVHGRKNGKGTFNWQMKKAASDLGFELIKIDCHHRGLRSLSKDLPQTGNFIVWVTRHYAGVSGGKIHDWSDGKCLRIQEVWQAIPIGSEIRLHSFQIKEKTRTRQTRELYTLVYFPTNTVVARYKRFPTKINKIIQKNGVIICSGQRLQGSSFVLRGIAD